MQILIRDITLVAIVKGCSAVWATQTWNSPFSCIAATSFSLQGKFCPAIPPGHFTKYFFRFFYNAYFTKSETKIRSQKQVENDKILDNMKCPKIDCNIEEKQFDAIKKIQWKVWFELNIQEN